MAFDCTLMDDPVVAADGHTYNRVDSETWLKEHDTSPLTHETLEHKMLIPNLAMRRHGASNMVFQRSSLGNLPNSRLAAAHMLSIK